MPASIVTTEDLQNFKSELLNEFRQMLLDSNRISLDKWIKSGELMDKLDISPGTLNNLRINGKLPFTKLGGIIYYDEEEINELLVQNKFDGYKKRSL